MTNEPEGKPTARTSQEKTLEAVKLLLEFVAAEYYKSGSWGCVPEGSPLNGVKYWMAPAAPRKALDGSEEKK